MKNKRTYYQLILDRSGSMTNCIEQTVSGVNLQIRRIKELAERFPEQELLTSLTLFNTTVTTPLIMVRPEELRELAYTDYRPDGGTALLDAIGITLHNLQKKIGPEVEQDAASVVVVIITDGYENSSRLYSHSQISSLILDLELSRKWTFSYLGATIDAVEIAMSLNIKRQNSMRFNLDLLEETNFHISDHFEGYIAEKQSGIIKENLFDEDDKINLQEPMNGCLS
jgi:hypothetical protein